jgi:DNA mismatch endonuclease (patch repair protein)
MQGNRSRDTAPELALRRVLHRRGLRYRINATAQPGIRCRADIVFRCPRVAVFVDGCFWHCYPTHGTRPATNAEYWQAKLARNVERDRRTDLALEAADWTVIRVWEHEQAAAAADLIEGIVRARR